MLLMNWLNLCIDDTQFIYILSSKVLQDLKSYISGDDFLKLLIWQTQTFELLILKTERVNTEQRDNRKPIDNTHTTPWQWKAQVSEERKSK